MENYLWGAKTKLKDKRKLTWSDAVVVSMLVATYLLVKSFTEVDRKKVATPIDAETIRNHMNLPPPFTLFLLWFPCWLTVFVESVRWCQPCKLVERQKSVNSFPSSKPMTSSSDKLQPSWWQSNPAAALLVNSRYLNRYSLHDQIKDYPFVLYPNDFF